LGQTEIDRATRAFNCGKNKVTFKKRKMSTINMMSSIQKYIDVEEAGLYNNSYFTL
jgi:hypothetical protein